MKTSKCLSLFLMVGHIISIGQVIGHSELYRMQLHESMLRGCNLLPNEQPVPSVETGIMVNIKKAFARYSSTFKKLPWPDRFKKGLEYRLEGCALPQKIATDMTTAHELELIEGASPEAATILRKLTLLTDDEEYSTLTLMGQMRCAEMIGMPVADIEQLSVRKNCIKAFYENEVLLSTVALLLKELKDTEPYVIDFCGKDGVSDGEKAVYPSALMNVLRLADVPAVTTFNNRSWLFMLTPAALPIIQTFTSLTAELGLYYFFYPKPNIEAAKTFAVDFMRTSYNLHTSKAALAMHLVFSPLYIAQLGMAKSVCDGIKQMQERVIGYATYMRTAQKLMQLLCEHPELVQCMPAIEQSFLRLNGDDESVSDTFFDINTRLMEESTFDEGEPSYFSSPGNTLLVYKHLCNKDMRKEYTPIVNTIAEIDVYATLAQKMHQHAESANAPFCFVEFIEGSDKPVVDIQNFWHPFISEKHAVPNSIVLNQDGARNMLITGPNTGGKSTNMKAMAISVLLAQTFGIAPASSMRMTPFSVISTYLNVIDDTSAGLSLFKAEVKRVQELMDAVKNLSAGQFAFVMLDEIFTGTSPDKAEELSYACMKKLSEFDHAIFVCATHFKKLTGLESLTNGITKNYQVEVIADETGRITKYTYKIVPGISKISSAQQVAEETGLVF